MVIVYLKTGRTCITSLYLGPTGHYQVVEMQKFTDQTALFKH